MLLPRAVLCKESFDLFIGDELALLVNAHSKLVALGKALVSLDHGLAVTARHAVQVVGMHSGDALGGRVIGRGAQDVHDLFHGDGFTHTVKQRKRVFADHTVGLTVLVQIDLAAIDLGIRRYVKELQRGGIGCGKVSADAGSHDGMRGGDFVKVVARGDVLIGKQVLIPAVAGNELPRRHAVFFDKFTSKADDLLHGPRVFELHLGQRDAEVQRCMWLSAKNTFSRYSRHAGCSPPSPRNASSSHVLRRTVLPLYFGVSSARSR